jgi:NDP-sugar pyrophosphorylase family protein
MSDVIGIGLAGGLGTRARPLTLEAADYVRSKATMSFLGRPLVDWQIRSLRDQGVSDFYVVARGKENRCQIKGVLGHGEPYGAAVRYSRARLDPENTGSGEATLRNLEHWGLRGLALVFPTDSVFDFDLGELARAHRASGALVTVAAVERHADEVAGKYGAMVTDADGLVRRFAEKPSRYVLDTAFTDLTRIPTNAGLYLFDCDRLRAVAGEPGLRPARETGLDWGKDLLPWLVGNGYPVRAHPIERLGDLGSPTDYLVTMREVLAGEYPQLTKLMDPPYAGNIWIHESTMRHRDGVTGMSLARKLTEGLVKIGPNVRIGRDVEIAPGAVITDSDVGDGVDLHAGAVVRRSVCLDGAVVGPRARIEDAYLGYLTRIDSTAEAPVVVDGFSALGDEVTVRRGVRLTGVAVHPRLVIPAGTQMPAGIQVESATDVLHWA